MKVQRIKRLIESLNPSEIKELNTLLETPFPEDSEYGKERDFSAVEIARQIEKGIIKETKEILMKQDEDGWSVAHALASCSDRTKWSTNDKEILMLQDEEGESVASTLAIYSSITKWITNDKDVLMLQDKWGWSAAFPLAYSFPYTKWTTNDPDILNLKTSEGTTVKEILDARRKKKNIEF